MVGVKNRKVIVYKVYITVDGYPHSCRKNTQISRVKVFSR